MSDRYIPVAYDPQKAPKSKIDYKTLYKVDILGFDPIIGHITNVSTTLYEMQNEYSPDSREYQEIDRRLKLCCSLQSRAIDSTKGIAFEGIPKHWLRRKRITDEMRETLSEEAIAEIEFNNRICIENRRPYFMRYLYPQKNRDYKSFREDINRACIVRWGKPLDELSDAERQSQEFKKIQAYIDRSFPLFETHGTMNRICRHMESTVAEIKQARRDAKSEGDIFDKLYSESVATELSLVPKMEEIYNEYSAFKRDYLLEDSEFNSYEQFYAQIRKKALENVSNNLQECANLAVYICYKLYPKRAKDFCWDCFGEGIADNVLAKAAEQGRQPQLPQADANGDISYLGKTYALKTVNLEDEPDADI